MSAEVLLQAPPNFRQIVYRAAGRAQVRAAIRDLYESLQLAIDQQKPRCDQSGRCCRFEEFGHRLFVTTMELATFVYELEMGGLADDCSRRPQSLVGCPFQLQNRCSVHPIRPFGCRIFFCDPTATEWQQDQYERFHASLKSLHGEFEVQYAYLEWRRALEAIGL